METRVLSQILSEWLQFERGSQIWTSCKKRPHGKAKEFVKGIMNILNMGLGKHSLQSISYKI